MLSRACLGGAAGKALSPASRRCYAAAASGTNPFTFEVADAKGVKVASRDDGSPTTSVAVVARAGSRYETLPGLAHGLERFAFKSTDKRSSLRVCRETELLGGLLSSHVSRENIVLRARFLRNDLPYFIEVLGDVLSKTRYTEWEFNEEVANVIKWDVAANQMIAADVALDAALGVAFHKGIGGSRLAPTPKYLSNMSIKEYASKVYNKSNVAVVASGASHAEVSKFTGEFFSDLPSGSLATSPESKYYGGETRIQSSAGNALVIGFSGSAGPPKFKPEYAVLSAILGGESSLKWVPGTSLLSTAVSPIIGSKAKTAHLAYSDAGFLYVTVTSPNVKDMTVAAQAVVKAIKELGNVKAEDVKKAIARIRFQLLAGAEDRSVALELIGQGVLVGGNASQILNEVKAVEGVTLDAVKKAAQSLLSGKASVAAVGDLYHLPFAEDLGLKV